MKKLLILLSVAVMLCSCKEFPYGAYHSASAIKTATSKAVVNDINTNPYVTGSLVKIVPNLIHLDPDTFDFSLLDREFELAAQYDTKITLIVTDSYTLPQFVLDSCENFSWYSAKFNEEKTTCLPWDENYQQYKWQLITALGARYDSNEYLAGVYITYSAMGNGAEMHFNVDEAAFTAAGYTPERLLESYNTVMGMYVSSFVDTPVIMEVHEVFGSDHLAKNAYDACYENSLGNCGVAAWWCSQKNAEGAEALVFPVVQLAAQQSFAVCQTVANFTDNSAAFDLPGQPTRTPEQTLADEAAFWMSVGVCTFEFWTKDLQNESLAETIGGLQCQISSTNIR